MTAVHFLVGPRGACQCPGFGDSSHPAELNTLNLPSPQLPQRHRHRQNQLAPLRIQGRVPHDQLGEPVGFAVKVGQGDRQCLGQLRGYGKGSRSAVAARGIPRAVTAILKRSASRLSGPA